jgi:hypothetical protein
MSKPLAPPNPREADFSTVDKVLTLVRARGGRATTSRRILLEVLFEADGHLSAEELAEAVQARAPDVHISTIYRPRTSWPPWPTRISSARSAGPPSRPPTISFAVWPGRRRKGWVFRSTRTTSPSWAAAPTVQNLASSQGVVHRRRQACRRQWTLHSDGTAIRCTLSGSSKPKS